MRLIFLSLFAATLCPGAALSQMAVTTFGATDAQQCYENARSESSRDAKPCDAALKTALSDGDRKKTLVNRGIIYNKRGQLMDALADFKAALAIDDKLAEAWLNRGNSYFLGGKNDRAIQEYQESLRLEISEPWAAWYNIGLAYEAKGDIVKAREAYRMALELNPDFGLAREKLGSEAPPSQ